ncbi:MAG: MBL fold metallo-hydrolase [Saprospiraceae bacterium]|nr:MBL fold metallo-hydrolase [Saprospiraceae bacterium]
MNVFFHYSGYCSSDNKHVYVGAPAGKAIFPAFWALLKHPTEGYILFDTGYASRFLEATSYFPNSIYAKMTPVTFQDSDSVVNILKNQHQIEPDAIRYIVISHFHGDHIGGLLDFPKAKIICTKMAFEHIWHCPNWLALSRAYLKDLLPKDLPQRTLFIEEIAEKTPHTHFKETWFWAEMGITFVHLPGHARGQVGLMFKSKGGSLQGDVFLVADAAWHIESIRRNVPPSPLVRLFVDSYAELKDSITRLHHFCNANPNVTPIVTHCKETLGKYLPTLNELY